MIGFHNQTTRADMRISKHLRVVVDRTARKAVRLEQIEPVLARMLRW